MRARKVVRVGRALCIVAIAGCAMGGAANAADNSQSAINAPLMGAHAVSANPVALGATSQPWRVSGVTPALGTRADTAAQPGAHLANRPFSVHGAVSAAPRRSAADYLLLTLVGFTLVAYQLLRKHRQLRPQTFSL